MFGNPHHQAASDHGGGDHVQDALVEVQRAGDVKPGFEVKRVDHLEGFVFVTFDAVDRAERDGAHQVEGEKRPHRVSADRAGDAHDALRAAGGPLRTLITNATE